MGGSRTASQGSSGRPLPVLVGAVILVVAALACRPAAPATGPVTSGVDETTVPAASPPPSSASALPSAPPPASFAAPVLPPDATLAAEGGDPVTGQLGTYLWLGTGSESPWLRGAPLTVGAGEPLSVGFDPDTDIVAWTVRSVPAGQQGPDGATTLAEGRGDPRFDAPGSGAWTLEVFVAFSAGAGEARYFWRLTVE
jgi:hypothetical protein